MVTGVSPHLLQFGLAALPPGNTYTPVCIFFTPGHPLGLGGTLFWILESSRMILPVDGAESTDPTSARGAVHMHTVCSPGPAQILVFTLSIQASDPGGALVNIGSGQ